MYGLLYTRYAFNQLPVDQFLACLVCGCASHTAPHELKEDDAAFHAHNFQVPAVRGQVRAHKFIQYSFHFRNNIPVVCAHNKLLYIHPIQLPLQKRYLYYQCP